MDDNRFLSSPGGRGTAVLDRPRTGAGAVSTSVWASPFAATDRALVVLIENGGVDLGIPDLVDKILDVIPGGSQLPSGIRNDLIEYIRNKIKGMTDTLLESADLALNGFSQAKPGTYAEVTVLRDSTASYNELKTTLLANTNAGKVTDIFILTHGGSDRICLVGDITGQNIKDLRTANGGKPLRIRSVYMMNCVGSSLNQAWIDAGAKVSSGSIRNNYLPEPTMHHFWTNWKAGQGFEAAVNAAYRQTINEMNGVLNGFVAMLGFAVRAIVGEIDVSTWDFVRDSAPVVKGENTLTISSDSLSFTQSVASSLSTTLLPDSVLRAFSEGNGPGASPTMALSPAGQAFVTEWENTAGAALIRETGQTLDVLVAKAVEALNTHLPAGLTQNQFDALVSFALGIGGRAFAASQVYKLLCDNKLDGIPAEMRKWVKSQAGGQVVDDAILMKRREAEVKLFSSAVAGGTTGPVPVAAPASFTMSQISRSLAAVDYTIPGLLVPLKQPTPQTCWAAVMAMMIGWRNQQSMAIRDALVPIGSDYVARFDAGQLLPPDLAPKLYADAGLVAITSFNPSIEGWEATLRQFGPLYVDVGYATSVNTHAIIVTGISGTGDAAGTTITYVDPAAGTVVNRSFAEFIREYEAPSVVTWPYTIVHWPAAASVAQPPAVTHSFEYRAPEPVSRSLAAYSYAQNPGILIAGIEVADAIQIGLGAVSIIQTGIGASQGSFTLTYAQAQRLLTPEARNQMPGSRVAKRSYRSRLMHIGSEGPLGIEWAQAEIVIEWEGNAYGEIGTPVIRRDLSDSTEWSKSSANVQISKIDRIPPPNSDPRTWPITYTYEGTFDPVGNGYFEFTGEFEINAFGGLKFNRHQVVSRSLMDFAIGGSPETYVKKGRDVTVAVPPIPDEQVAYLKAHPPT